MSSKILFQGFVRKAKEVLQGFVKTKTQNVGVKVTVTAKPKETHIQVVRYQPQLTTNKLYNVWYKILPKVYFNSLASHLGRQAAWRCARNMPLLSFVGLVMAQHAEKEEDELVEKIQEFVKTAQISSSPLLQQVQQLSLDRFEFGQLIGQGCNAAVYEARLKSEETGETEINNTLTHQEDTSASSDGSEGHEIFQLALQHNDDASYDSDGESDITVLSLSEDEIDTADAAPVEFHVNNESPFSFELEEDVSDVGSDFEILALTDDDMMEDDKAPLHFTVPLQNIPIILQDANDVSMISHSDNDIRVQSETSVEQRAQTSLLTNSGEWTLSRHLDYSPTGVLDAIIPSPDALLSMSCGEIASHMKTDTVPISVSGGHSLEEEVQYDSLDSNFSAETSDRFNLAVKMMFNYSAKSNASAIFQEMQRETVPARLAQTREQMDTWQNGNKARKKTLPPHPNIVEMWGVFVDPVPHLPDSLLNYPAALPARLNPQGIGRNMTMFLVMKKYQCTLAEYLLTFNPSMRERLMLLAQLFEALDHLRRHNIAHRDLKLDNIFLDTFTGGVPQLVLGDFGCCLADDKHGLCIPYNSEYIDKGGNTALMAPEIATVEPGTFSCLDYRKSDLWAAGTLAYQILGADNPFYTNQNAVRLDSRTYNEQELPPLPEIVPSAVSRLISAILNRDPDMRPTARLAADVLHVLLWAPSDWLLPSNSLSRSQVTWWLISMATEVLLGSRSSEHLMKRGFLQNVNMNNLNNVFRFLCVKIDSF